MMSFFILSGTSTGFHANAYVLIGTHRIASPSESMKIYCPVSSIWTSWSTPAIYAAVQWGATYGVTLGWNYTPTYSLSDSFTVMLSDYSSSTDNCNAYTTYYYRSGYQQIYQINPVSSNWSYGSIKMNNYNMSGATLLKKKDVMTHEFGHVVGLGENNSDPTSIMCQEVYGRTAHAPSDDDYDGAEYLYS